MEIELGRGFQRKLIKLYRKDRGLGVKIDKKLSLFSHEPNASGLRLHKLSGGKRGYWSLAIESDLRIIFCFTKKGILLTDIGSHNEVY
ncbi:MAG: type II toxin-antitoxin system mRNA interferase toxin, RelE/StbE family [Candidatus Beckwithbacteria bacterium]